MKLISFSMTTKAFLEGRKTVTRRLGWEWLKPGTRLEAVEKAMGLKPGEQVKRLGVIEVVDVRRERLDAITQEDVNAEGFGLDPQEFVCGFCKAMKCTPDTVVTRIEFRKVEASARPAPANEDAKLVKRVCDFADGMTPWEVQFVEDVAKSFERGVPLTQADLFPSEPAESVEVLEKDAVFSPCRKWRYSLTRNFAAQGAERKRLVVIGLNPSTADETQDDPTIRRCIGFAKAWGFDGLLMLNLFAFRSTDPRGLPEDRARAVGPENDHYLSAITRGRQTLCAWGVHGALHGRAKEVFLKLANAGRALLHLGVTKAGHPLHPLYLPATTKPLTFAGDVYL